MKNNEFIVQLQNRIALLAIGPSTLRNQGAPGMIKIARAFCSKIDLKSFNINLMTGNFQKYLNDQTNHLQRAFPKRTRNNFGAARKALSIFFRDVVYNKYMIDYLKIKDSQKFEQRLSQLELPLDSYTAGALIQSNPELKADWYSIKSLTNATNTKFQETAAAEAKKLGIARIHLDVLYWNTTKSN